MYHRAEDFYDPVEATGNVIVDSWRKMRELFAKVSRTFREKNFPLYEFVEGHGRKMANKSTVTWTTVGYEKSKDHLD